MHTLFSKQVEDRIKKNLKNLYDSAYFKKLQKKSSYFLLIKWMDMNENALVFSQSEACNFLMYIIKHCNNLVQVF